MKLILLCILMLVPTHGQGTSWLVVDICGSRYAGVPLSSYVRDIDPPFEISLENHQGAWVTLSSDARLDHVIIAEYKDGTALEPTLVGSDVPPDLHLEGIRTVEVRRLEPAQIEPPVLEVLSGGDLIQVELSHLEPFILEGDGEIRSSTGRVTQGRYAGIPLLDLARMFHGSSHPGTITAEAADGYRVSYEVSWLEDHEGTWILAWRDEKGMMDQSYGPFRTISVGDPPPRTEGRRSARQVVRIIFEGTRK